MSSDRKAHVAYLVRFTIGMVLYSLAIFANRFWLHSVEGNPWRFVVALLPMIGACVCAWAMRKMFQDIDEMQQKKMLDALVISSAGTILTSIAYRCLASSQRLMGRDGVGSVLRHRNLVDGLAVPVRNDLKVLRAQRSWTQARLAEELGVSRQTVNALEAGRYDPSLPLAFTIARVFGLTIEEIFFPDDEAS